MTWTPDNIAALNALVGRPWEDGAEGPRAFGCWGLVVYIERRFYGRELPTLPYNSNRVLECARIIRRRSADVGTPVATPVDGCAVVMGTAKLATHMGVYVELDGGRVFHTDLGLGVVSQRLGDMMHAGVHFLKFHEGGITCRPM